jgi:large subunit ribosomal protein L1
MAKTGKKLRKAYESINRDAFYKLDEAVKIIKANAKAKFDETIEIAVNLDLDTRHADQQVRGVVSLPSGTGKAVRVAVFARGDKAEAAKRAGADLVGAEDLAEKIGAGEINFDRVIATPDLMGIVGRLGKVLGPRGLMPTPKAGTVIPANGDVAAAVREFKAGKVEYRADAGGNVHAGVGKLSFDEDKLADNIQAFVDQVRHAKPAGVRGNYVESVTVSATMSPGIRVTV